MKMKMTYSELFLEFCDVLRLDFIFLLFSSSLALLAAIYAVGSNRGRRVELFEPTDVPLLKEALEPTDDATLRTDPHGDVSRLRICDRDL